MDEDQRGVLVGEIERWLIRGLEARRRGGMGRDIVDVIESGTVG